MGVKMNEIRIEWDGPYKLADIGCDKEKDYGIYQVYGFHPVYGDNVLLYIGQAKDQTFAKRLSQEEWKLNYDFKNLQIYVGRLMFGYEQPSNVEWENLVDIAEKMLIYAHAPAMNSSNIASISRDKQFLKKHKKIRIFNYDQCRSLFPEISGELWIKEFEFDGVFKKKI